MNIFSNGARQLCRTFFCLIVMTGCTTPSGTRSHAMNEYSHKVKYKENQDLSFPDFTLRYSGQTKVIPPRYPRGFIYYNFLVKANGHAQKIRWSSGTGMIAPLDFKVDGKAFWLELQACAKFGHLAADELVISPRNTP